MHIYFLLISIVDVWTKKFLVVTHGPSWFTGTTVISFQSALDAIKKSAFSDSNPYPVVISIENHLNKKNQKIMAKALVETLGPFLDTEMPPVSGGKFPSPKDKKGKIFIKAKIGSLMEEKGAIANENDNQIVTSLKIPPKETGDITRDDSNEVREGETEVEIPSERNWFKQCLFWSKKQKVCS